MKYNKNLSIILAIAICFLTGCTSQTAEPLPTISDMRENATEEEKKIVELSRLTNAEAMEKHYGGNLYFEDYGTLAEDLNAYFKERLEKDYREHADSPVFVDPHIEFYNLTLKRLKDGEIQFEDVYVDLKEHVKVFKTDIFDYAKEEDAAKNNFETKFGFYWFDNVKEKYEKSGMRALDIRYIDVNPLKVSSEQGEQTYSSLYKGIH